MGWQAAKNSREQVASIKNEMRSILDASKGRAMSDDEQRRFDDLERKAIAAENTAKRHEAMGQLDGSREFAPIFDPRTLSRYSLLRAIERRSRNLALDGLEAEVDQELSQRNGRSAKGFFFPTEIAIGGGGDERRDLTLTTGQYAKPTITAGASFIESLRNRMVLSAAGASVLTGLTGDLSIPKQSAASSVYWVTEGNAPTEGAPAIQSQVALAPKTVGTFIDLSRKFLIQSSIDAELFARNELAKGIAHEVDRAGLNGSGSGAEPQGILANSSVTTVALGTDGAAPTWAKMVEMETTVAGANADVDQMSYIVTSAARGKLKTVETVSGSGRFIWADDNTVNGYRALTTNALPSNLTKAMGSSLSAAIFGNWSDLLIGYWTALDILVDPFSGGTAGTVRVIGLQDVDIKLRRTESFSKIVDMVTT